MIPNVVVTVMKFETYTVLNGPLEWHQLIYTSAVPSKNAVSVNIKHSRYFH